jgi:hypothetical protein
MLRKFLAMALVLGVCVTVTACEKEEPTTNTTPPTDASGAPVTPEGPGEGMTIEEPPTDDGQ